MWQMRKIRLWEKTGWIIIRSRETAGAYLKRLSARGASQSEA